MLAPPPTTTTTTASASAAASVVLRCVQLNRIRSRFAGLARQSLPPFHRILGLTASQLNPSQVSYQNQDRILKVRLPWKTLWGKHGQQQQQQIPFLSTYLALVDEITTMALFEADVERGNYGVSLSLDATSTVAPLTTRTTKNNTKNDYDSIQDLEITAQVQKLGKSVAFLTATVQDSSSTRTVLCRASHVKYLTSGSGWIQRWFLSKSGWPWLVWWYGADKVEFQVDYPQPRPLTEQEEQEQLIMSKMLQQTLSLDQVFSSIQYDTSTQSATFQPTASTSNGLGTLHGGVHAILVEMVARQYLQRTTTTPDQANNNNKTTFYLESLQMKYLAPVLVQEEEEKSSSSSSSSPPVTIQVIHDERPTWNRCILTLQVSTRTERDPTSNSRVASTGECHFSLFSAHPDNEEDQNSSKQKQNSKSQDPIY